MERRAQGSEPRARLSVYQAPQEGTGNRVARIDRWSNAKEGDKK